MSRGAAHQHSQEPIDGVFSCNRRPRDIPRHASRGLNSSIEQCPISRRVAHGQHARQQAAAGEELNFESGAEPSAVEAADVQHDRIAHSHELADGFAPSAVEAEHLVDAKPPLTVGPAVETIGQLTVVGPGEKEDFVQTYEKLLQFVRVDVQAG